MQIDSDHQGLSHTPGAATDTADEFFKSLYAELRRRARGQLLHSPLAHSLRPTALVHEAYMRVKMQNASAWESRSQFLAVITTVMRNVLIDTLRQKYTAKRGGGWIHVSLKESGQVAVLHTEDLTVLADALGKLERDHPDAARLVLLRFLMGLTMTQIASIESVSKRTVERRWRFARAWLQAELVVP